MSNLLDLLEASREYLSDREHWTQGWYWRDESDEEINDVYIQTQSVAKCCALGTLTYIDALNNAEGFSINAAYDALNKATHDLYGVQGISMLNDTNGHDDVLRIYDYAIEQERKRQ